MTLPPSPWSYALADETSATLRPDGPGRQSSEPSRPVSGVISLVPNGFNCLGAFRADVAPILWGYRSTLEQVTLHAADELTTSGDPALTWHAWATPTGESERQRLVETWYAWICDRWPQWRAYVQAKHRPPVLTIPEQAYVNQVSPTVGGTLLREVRRDALVIGRHGDMGPWRPIGPLEWLPAGTWPSVVHFQQIDHADGSWSRVVHPIIEAPAWPASPLMLPGGMDALRAWAECLPRLVAANHGRLSPNDFWTGCWNSLAGLPPRTGLWLNVTAPAQGQSKRR